MAVIFSVVVLAVTALVVTSAILAAGLWLTSRHGPTGTSVRFGIVAGVAEVGAAAMYLLWVNVGGSPIFAMANALLVLGPAMLPLAFHHLRPLPVSRWCVLLSFAAVAAVAATSLLLPTMVAEATRTGALAMVCACAAVAAAVSPEAGRPSIRVIAVTVGLYAVYCGARVVPLVRAGAEGTPIPIVFTDVGAIPLGVAAMTAVGAATVWFWVAVSRAAHHDLTRSKTRLIIVDRDARALRPDLIHELREAASDLDPTALAVHGGTCVGDAEVAAQVLRRLRRDFHWKAEELSLVETIPSKPGRP